MRLEGKVALLSGGAGGIGTAEAKLFASEGAAVVIGDLAEEHGEALASEIVATGGKATFVRLDVLDEASWKAAVSLAVDTYGKLNILVNNAGIAGPTAALEDISPEDWERTIAVNLNSMFYCARRAIPLLKEAAAAHGDASMINLSSTAGRYGFAQRTPYSASKWAVVGLTKSLSIELGAFGVRVNAIGPGLIETPLNADARARVGPAQLPAMVGPFRLGPRRC